jgi:hypothetical protein
VAQPAPVPRSVARLALLEPGREISAGSSDFDTLQPRKKIRKGPRSRKKNHCKAPALPLTSGHWHSLAMAGRAVRAEDCAGGERRELVSPTRPTALDSLQSPAL